MTKINDEGKILKDKKKRINTITQHRHTPADEVAPAAGGTPGAGAAATSAPPPPSKESRPPLRRSRVPPEEVLA